ncbi:MAG: hypothetical protein GY799_14830 [Desulfobulbaceae bacterium]|nr:hypothetical protein [Desulfobulbaceae bacterium]
MKISKYANKQNLHCIKDILAPIIVGIVCLYCLAGVCSTKVFAGSKTCGAFFLRNSNGDIINPLTGENGEQPFSTRKTCGACHDYQLITKGFHFQQGWERISDSFDAKKPWVLSDGMMGKH